MSTIDKRTNLPRLLFRTHGGLFPLQIFRHLPLVVLENHAPKERSNSIILLLGHEVHVDKLFWGAWELVRLEKSEERSDRSRSPS